MRLWMTNSALFIWRDTPQPNEFVTKTILRIEIKKEEGHKVQPLASCNISNIESGTKTILRIDIKKEEGHKVQPLASCNISEHNLNSSLIIHQ